MIKIGIVGDIGSGKSFVSKQFGYPVLTGISRKSMISKTIKKDTNETLNGTTVLNTICLQFEIIQ